LELTDKEKMKLLVSMAKKGKATLVEIAEQDSEKVSAISQGCAIGIKTAIKTFDSAFNLIGEPI
jgi:hypothetical protein